MICEKYAQNIDSISLICKNKYPKLLYKFRPLEIKQYSGKMGNSGKMLWPNFAAMILQCEKPLHH